MVLSTSKERPNASVNSKGGNGIEKGVKIMLDRSFKLQSPVCHAILITRSGEGSGGVGGNVATSIYPTLVRRRKDAKNTDIKNTGL